MKKVQYSIYGKETNTAGGKAKKDIYIIMKKLGFLSSYNPAKIRLIRVIQQFLSFRKFLRANISFIQYPAIDKRILDIFNRFFSKRGITIALVHDLHSLQYEDYRIEDEIKQLEKFDYLIVHNLQMKNYLIKAGYTGKIVILYLFDYLHDMKRKINQDKLLNSICFAGNLEKSKFLLDLNKINKYKFLLYGLKGEMDFSKIRNVEYKGFMQSNEIVYNLQGDFGLIWDGESIDCCDGVSGRYLKYNNPHKLSLYIAAGKPVITWKKSAISEFVIKNKIGIVVNSLKELENIDIYQEFDLMKENVLKIKKLISNGEYLKKVVEEILEDINQRDRK